MSLNTMYPFSLHHILLFILSLSLHGQVHCSNSCVQNLPNASDIQALTMDSRNQLVAPVQQLRVFPNITFTCNGSIVGWRLAAIDHTRRGRPELSVWRRNRNSANQFAKVTGRRIDSCTVSESMRTLGASTVMIHENILNPPIPFEAGDVLGILFLIDTSASYIPLLYNVTGSGGLMSYYRTARGSPQNDVFTLTNVAQDTLSPLISLQMCLSNSSCTSQSMPTCLGGPTSAPPSSSPSSSPTPSPTPSPTLPSSTNEPALSTETLIFAIVIPVVVVLVVLVSVIVVLILCCVCRNRGHNKHSSNFTEEIQMSDVIENGASVVHNGNSAFHGSAEVQRKPSYLVSLSNDLYDLPKHAEVAPYEEPVVSLSQYETIGEGEEDRTYAALVPPLTGGTFSPNVLPIPGSPAFYHTLETPPTPASVLSHIRRDSPGQSPKQRHSPRQSPGESPLFKTKLYKPDGKENFKFPPRLGTALSQEEADIESGVYVPTQEQRSQFNVEPVVFDDTIYSCLSKAPNSPLVNNWRFFEEVEIYWKPASDPSSLYAQLASMKYREILKNQIQVTDHLGSGEFGTVCKGQWHAMKGTLDVAVKMLNNKATEKDVVRFLQEAAIMGQFRHPNIVRLHGVVTVGEPVMIILELMANGDLRNYLKSLRPVPGEMVPSQLPQRLLDFSSQIALGMEYLSRKEFVHRDLAARNILLTEEYVCKIADFGMSRDLDDDNYYISHGGKIPIKWTSPEALHYRKYSAASDIWSFGVLMYEIWSLGHSPFKQQSPEDAIKLVDAGYRLPPPPGCPRAIYEFMIECWNPEPSYRPTFTKVVQTLSQSDDTLLKWGAEDIRSHPQAAALGAPIEAGEPLYPELQKLYIEIADENKY